MFKEDKELYEFGKFRLDVAEHFLARLATGDRVPLSEKAFQTLCILVRNSGHLLSKNELLDQIWTDSFVEENNLDKCIFAIRRALGEKPGEQKFIETVRKHGYRFVAEVTKVYEPGTAEQKNGNGYSPLTVKTLSASKVVEVPPENGFQIPFSAAGESVIAPAAEPNRRRRIIFFSGGFLSAIFLIAFLIYKIDDVKPAPELSRNKIKSIAVLPLKPINAGVRDELHEIGIADSLIHRLGSMKGFIVRPLSATRKYADIEQDPLAAGKEQQVDYVLASNYQLAGGRIRITAQLLNVANGQIEETYKIEKEAGDVFAMQDAVAGEIGNKLLSRFATISTTPAVKRGTSDEDAYRLYQQGMYHYDKRTLANARKAVEALEQSLQLDPNFARAWAGKAHAHRSLGNFGGDPHDEYKKSIESINRALALDENLADAHSALCENKFFYEWDFDGAERECKRAIELDPNSSIAHDIYARYLYSRGRFDEAITEIKTSIDLEPTSLFSQRNYGVSLYYARRYPEAVTQFKRVVEMDPNFVATYAWFVNTLHSQDNEAEAFEWFIKWQAVLKTDEETVQAYKTAYQTAGWQAVGRERVKRFDERKIRSYYLEACLTAHTGDKDKAFEYLVKSYQRREWGMAYLRIEPSLDVLRSDPRFDELVRRVGLN